jgi:dCTP deaminase
MVAPLMYGTHRPGVISYGLTSYGYDVRVGHKYKVFTNVWGATVDPKNFDPKSFVDVEADHCIIPPNSFALAETVEYFEIPRDILVVCVGKSTYARCFSGRTRVATVDGQAPTLEEMVHRTENGEAFFGYSLSEHGRIVVTKLTAPRFIGRDKLLEITLDNGEIIEATPDHLFILRDRRSIEAAFLRPGQSLMPLHRDLYRGYEMIYQPVDGHLYPTHRLADEWNLRHGLYADIPGTHRHHRDHKRLNNNPWNIERMEASEHIRYHNAQNYGEEFDPVEHGESIKSAFEPLRTDPEWVARFSQVQTARALEFWNGAEHAKDRAKLLHQRQHITGETVRAALAATGSIRGAARLGCDRSVFRRFPEVVHAFAGRKVSNHKITSIRELPGEHDVYCLTVPEAGNFALEAGVFVHNCGIIINVTPLEPEWRGKVTIEISNTTPLPAKIYSGEGIAQLLFFKADSVCEVSYADKKGKYQNQNGLTLPIVEH